MNAAFFQTHLILLQDYYLLNNQSPRDHSELQNTIYFWDAITADMLITESMRPSNQDHPRHLNFPENSFKPTSSNGGSSKKLEIGDHDGSFNGDVLCEFTLLLLLI